MLKKLIKYDLKVQLKLLGAAWMVVLLAAGIAALATVMQSHVGRWQWLMEQIEATAAIVAVLFVIVMVVGTVIYMVLWFRRNLFKDQGYLMHTLPVQPWQLYVSKYATAGICTLLSELVGTFAILLAFCFPKSQILQIQEILHMFGLPAWLGVYVVFSIPLSLPCFYLALSYGYTLRFRTASPVNRDLMSIVSYAVIYLIQQAVNSVLLVVLFVAEAAAGRVNVEELFNASDRSAFLSFYGDVLAMAGVVTLVYAVIWSLLSIRRMGRYLNID